MGVKCITQRAMFAGASIVKCHGDWTQPWARLVLGGRRPLGPVAEEEGGEEEEERRVLERVTIRTESETTCT